MRFFGFFCALCELTKPYVILCFLLAVNFATLFLIGYTFLEDPVVLFSRKFLSPFSSWMMTVTTPTLVIHAG